ncbi:hypothetical protein Catovirus_1_1007 [Catovirus CTV1]|uniref:Uncharacterized protein n=1 Tax=Catovirus CTV1 TaxID=1977631 RepID=A0A1V0SB62_9VIRU|nr:hypothetical protein Catovirus_1_1007 [Catovirus CTV1]
MTNQNLYFKTHKYLVFIFYTGLLLNKCNGIIICIKKFYWLNNSDSF